MTLQQCLPTTKLALDYSSYLFALLYFSISYPTFFFHSIVFTSDASDNGDFYSFFMKCYFLYATYLIIANIVPIQRMGGKINTFELEIIQSKHSHFFSFLFQVPVYPFHRHRSDKTLAFHRKIIYSIIIISA